MSEGASIKLSYNSTNLRVFLNMYSILETFNQSSIAENLLQVSYFCSSDIKHVFSIPLTCLSKRVLIRMDAFIFEVCLFTHFFFSLNKSPSYLNILFNNKDVMYHKFTGNLCKWNRQRLKKIIALFINSVI